MRPLLRDIGQYKLAFSVSDRYYQLFVNFTVNVIGHHPKIAEGKSFADRQLTIGQPFEVQIENIFVDEDGDELGFHLNLLNEGGTKIKQLTSSGDWINYDPITHKLFGALGK